MVKNKKQDRFGNQSSFNSRSVDWGPIKRQLQGHGNNGTIFDRLGLGNRPNQMTGQADVKINSITVSRPNPEIRRVTNQCNEIRLKTQQVQGQIRTLPPRFISLSNKSPPPPPPPINLPKFLSFKIQISNPEATEEKEKSPSPSPSPIKNNVGIDQILSDEDENEEEVEDLNSDNELEQESIASEIETSQIEEEEDAEISCNEDEDNPIEESEFEDEEMEYEVIEEEYEIDDDDDCSTEIQKSSKPSPEKTNISAEENKLKNVESQSQRPKSKIVQIKWDSSGKNVSSKSQNVKKEEEKIIPKNKSNLRQNESSNKLKSVIKTSPTPTPLKSSIIIPPPPRSSIKKCQDERKHSTGDSLTNKYNRNRTNMKSLHQKDKGSKFNNNDRKPRISVDHVRIQTDKREKVVHDKNRLKNNLAMTKKPEKRPSTSATTKSTSTIRKNKVGTLYTFYGQSIEESSEYKPKEKDVTRKDSKVKNISNDYKRIQKSEKGECRIRSRLSSSSSTSNKLKNKYSSYYSYSSSSNITKRVKTEYVGSSSSKSRTCSTKVNLTKERKSEKIHQDQDRRSRNKLELNKSTSGKIDEKRTRIQLDRDRNKSPERQQSRKDAIIDRKRPIPTSSPSKRKVDTAAEKKPIKSPAKYSQTREILSCDETIKDRTSLFKKFGIFNDDHKVLKDEEVSLIRRRRISHEEDKPKSNLISFVPAGKSKLDDVKVNEFRDDDIDQMVNLENYGNVALKIALSMGFQPGKGLGKKDQGILVPIKVDKNAERKPRTRRDGIP